MEKETIIITTGEHSSCLKENKFGGSPERDCVSIHITHPESVCVMDGHRKLYTESDLNAERLAGQYEAWELARKIACSTADGGYSIEELNDIYDLSWSGDILAQYGYCEAADMAQKWEEKIRVGDVVRLRYGGKDDQLAVVTYVMPDLLTILLASGNTSTVDKGRCTKLGKKLNIESLLVELNGEEE